MELHNWEIWIGWHHMGQGHHPPTEPMHVATVEARTFSVACLKYEFASKLQWLTEADEKGQYIGPDIARMDYDFNENRNSWTGLYYPSREDALKSFERKPF